MFIKHTSGKPRLNKNQDKFILQSRLALLSQFFIFASLVQGAPKYTIIDIGTLGGDFSVAQALNEHGHVVKMWDSHLFLWILS